MARSWDAIGITLSIKPGNPGTLPAVTMSGWSVADWLAAVAGRPRTADVVTGATITGATTVLLARRLAPFTGNHGRSRADSQGAVRSRRAGCLATCWPMHGGRSRCPPLCRRHGSGCRSRRCCAHPAARVGPATARYGPSWIRGGPPARRRRLQRRGVAVVHAGPDPPGTPAPAVVVVKGGRTRWAAAGSPPVMPLCPTMILLRYSSHLPANEPDALACSPRGATGRRVRR
jgi:hypothetical protein